MADRPQLTRLRSGPDGSGPDGSGPDGSGPDGSGGPDRGGGPAQVAALDDLTDGDGGPGVRAGQAAVWRIGDAAGSVPGSARLAEIPGAPVPESVAGGAVDLARISAASSTPVRVARVAGTGARRGPAAGDGSGRPRAGQPPGDVRAQAGRPGGARDRLTGADPRQAGGVDRRSSRAPGGDIGRNEDNAENDPRSSPASGRSRSRGGPKQIDPGADPVAAAKEICLGLLTIRARTHHELADALRRRGVPDEAAATTLERFDEVGLIDDAAFAGQWVRSRQRTRGLSRRALAVELRRKGVDDDIADGALAEVDGAAEEERARELVDRKLRTVPADTPDQRVSAARRLVEMLARKGYSGGIAYRVVREALAAHGVAVEELGDGPSDD